MQQFVGKGHLSEGTNHEKHRTHYHQLWVFLTTWLSPTREILFSCDELLFWPFKRYSTSLCLSFHTGDKKIPLTWRDVVLINAQLHFLDSQDEKCSVCIYILNNFAILLKKSSFEPLPVWGEKSSQQTQEIRIKPILCTPQTLLFQDLPSPHCKIRMSANYLLSLYRFNFG